MSVALKGRKENYRNIEENVAKYCIAAEESLSKKQWKNVIGGE